MLVEDLAKALPDSDAELQRLAAELARVNPADAATGVLLERVKAANLRLREISRNTAPRCYTSPGALRRDGVGTTRLSESSGTAP